MRTGIIHCEKTAMPVNHLDLWRIASRMCNEGYGWAVRVYSFCSLCSAWSVSIHQHPTCNMNLTRSSGYWIMAKLRRKCFFSHLMKHINVANVYHKLLPESSWDYQSDSEARAIPILSLGEGDHVALFKVLTRGTQLLWCIWLILEDFFCEDYFILEDLITLT